MANDARSWIHALRASHDALVSLVSGFSSEDLDKESYCKGWDVSQLLSHIGSGAEIALTNLERALAQEEPLGRDDFPVIWSRWNALNPREKASQCVVWDRRYVSVLEGLDDATLKDLRVKFLTMSFDVAGAVGLRLAEHALHSWDVAVTFDPQAEVLGSSAALVLERLPFTVERACKPGDLRGRVEVKTVRPDKHFVLTVGETAKLEEVGDGAPPPTGPYDGTVQLPSAALARLVSGRLDPEHTPTGVKAAGKIGLDELRSVFPGF
ncbi:MAG TPA: maleylpyruvate isomerase family mycothiol-dependent enzyme [Acidimicrobiales bacterium]|nr:maleylpyruvate isomerase family mycothiol-dependent enzyme [Acidimicrobiales bacterium]